MARFLIVDDDHTSRILLERFLSPLGHCDLAQNGRKAIDAFQTALESGNRYDLVCLDIMMPGADGHQVLDAIRKIEHVRGIDGSDGAKVVMATALCDSKHCIQAFREGCESYVTKPINEQTLLDQVRSLLGEFSGSHSAQEEEMDTSGALSSRARYLIVDDDCICRELLKDILSPYGRCDFAHDGAEAIDAVRLAIEDGTPYDLVCLDIMMPGTSGHEALQGIRRFEAEHGIYGYDGVKVIIITALKDSKHCVQAFREGCESYVTKPIDPADLLARMRQLGLLTSEASPCENA